MAEQTPKKRPATSGAAGSGRSRAASSAAKATGSAGKARSSSGAAKTRTASAKAAPAASPASAPPTPPPVGPPPGAAPQATGAPSAAPPPGLMLESTARNYAMWAHLSALLSPLVSIPGIVGALIFWLLGKDKSALVNEHGKEEVNFQITLILAVLAGVLASVVTLGIGLLVVLPLGLVVWILAIVWQIQASMAASRGEYFRFPVNLRVIS